MRKIEIGSDSKIVILKKLYVPLSLAYPVKGVHIKIDFVESPPQSLLDI